MVRLLALGAFLSIPLASAAAAPPLQPSAKWVVNFDDAQCIASRNYGSEHEPLFLGFKTASAGELVHLMVVQPKDVVEFADSVPVSLATDGGAPFTTTMAEFASEDLEQQAYRIELTGDRFAALQQARTLSIRSGSDVDLSFALDEMQPLAKVLDQCVAELGEAPPRK